MLELDTAGLSPVSAADAEIATTALRSAVPRQAVPGLDASIRPLHHTRLGVAGQPVPATTLLLTPKNAPPAGGWPIVDW